MLQQLFSSRKSILLVLAGVATLALLLLTWRIVSLQKSASQVVSEPVFKITYCGAEPEALCVLSFGRDAEENLVVNVFVPERKFPDFYLKIKRITGESIYECEKNREVQTIVLCYGDMVNLQEKMEISLFAKADDRMLAAGTFTLNAILISTAQAQDVQGTFTPAPAILADTETATPVSLTQEVPLVTITFTPEPSYPNPSYP
ncbi:MAG: hypothetical protein IH588_04435 [Anaerolineales bacterium]|nr:hypothetical protein [Anaerolineales bacterium]